MKGRKLKFSRQCVFSGLGEALYVTVGSVSQQPSKVTVESIDPIFQVKKLSCRSAMTP